MTKKDSQRISKIVEQCNVLQNEAVRSLGDAYESGYRCGIIDVWRAVQRVVDRNSCEDLKKICRRYTVDDILAARDGNIKK